jgi:hypothetical protein
MASQATATLDANDEVCGPINVPNGHGAAVHIVVTGTITVTLQRAYGGLAYVTVLKPDGDPAAFTASYTGQIDSPGDYKLVASGVSGGSAACALSGNRL